MCLGKGEHAFSGGPFPSRDVAGTFQGSFASPRINKLSSRKKRKNRGFATLFTRRKKNCVFKGSVGEKGSLGGNSTPRRKGKKVMV